MREYIRTDSHRIVEEYLTVFGKIVKATSLKHCTMFEVRRLCTAAVFGRSKPLFTRQEQREAEKEDVSTQRTAGTRQAG